MEIMQTLLTSDWLKAYSPGIGTLILSDYTCSEFKEVEIAAKYMGFLADQKEWLQLGGGR